jgi:3-oxoacyl-[acyl-carrier-protein] synthase III
MGFYLPETRVRVDALAAAAGVPAKVAAYAGATTVREAPEHVLPVQMALSAAHLALKEARLDASDLDAILWCGAAVPEYVMPNTAGLIQHRLGAGHAQAFDVGQGCAAMLTGLQVACALQALDQTVRSVLLVTADKWTAFTLHHNADSVFFGEGGGAVVLRQGHPCLVPTAFHTITDGGYYGLWQIPAGGVVTPASIETVGTGAHVYQCVDHETAHGAFQEMYVPTIVRSIRSVLSKAGIRADQVAFVSMVNANLRVLQLALEDLDIPEERSSADYLREYGHFGSQDVFFNLHHALGEGRLQPGEYALLVTTGIGFFWVSAVVRC